MSKAATAWPSWIQCWVDAVIHRRQNHRGRFLAGMMAGVIACVHGGDLPAKEIGTAGQNLVATGRQLFLMNCAHCHGTDARGDEGPDLHGVVKSDQRLAALITDGKKGEMPKFGAKLSTNDV